MEDQNHNYDGDKNGGETLGPNDIAECPVMPGRMVVKAEAERSSLVRDYRGRRYYLCCTCCGPKWDSDPAKYAGV